MLSLYVIVVLCIPALCRAEDELRPTSSLPHLCVVCKCTPSNGSQTKYNVHCTDANAAFELTRDDSWPAAVRSVSLSHANLTSLPKLPQQNLHSLSLSHNALISLPDKAFDLLHLKELNLGYNGLKELTLKSIIGSNELKVLHLQHNSFEKLDWKFLNNLENLQELYLQENYIQTLEGRSNLPQLKILNLCGNALEELSADTCSGLSNLEELLLADNQLKSVPESLLQLQTLQRLVLDGNLITHVQDGAFYSLSALRVLSLSHLPELSEVNGAALRGLTFLAEFHCSHNPRLASIHRTLLFGEDAAQHDWKIINVDLSYNALTSIPSDLAPWSMLGSLNLQGNPWNCSCSAQWMLDTLVPVIYAKNSSFLEEVRCKTPPRMSGKRLVHWLDHSVDTKTFCKEDDRAAPLTQVSLLQSGSSYGMLIALTVVAVVAAVLLVLGFVLTKRADRQKKELATKLGRCRNPRNGHIRLINPKHGI